jgi:WD40 repeat protein
MRMATGSWDQIAKIWDAETGKYVLTLSGHDGWVTSVAWSLDGKRFASASEYGTVRVFAIGIRDLMTVAQRRLTDHPSEKGSFILSRYCNEFV